MKIRTKYYFHDKGKYFEYGGRLQLQARQIVRLGNKLLDSARPFYYDDTDFEITYERGNEKLKVEVNRILTEATYNKSQKEYLVRLSWFQQQKLLWMFNRHWLQQPGNTIHLVIAMLIIGMAFLGFRYLAHLY